MRERVSVIHGKKPIILVVPHGADDTNTAVIAEFAAKYTNCCAVINRGFERSEEVNEAKDLADCNRIDHVKQEVVFDEFLRPIKKFREKFVHKSFNANLSTGSRPGVYTTADPVHIFYIHGCGDGVHKEAGELVQVIVGYGLGAIKHSLSCDLWRKDAFVQLFQDYAVDGNVYEGKSGGKYAGRDSNNMNQYFRKHERYENTHSMQLKFPYSWRNTETSASLTGILLSTVLVDYLEETEFDGASQELFI
jgi:hypothetical protein